MADPTPRRRRLRALLAPTALVVALSTAACGGAPARADFVAKIKKTIGTDLNAGLKAQGVDAATADRVITEFVNCQYDAVKSDVDLLQRVYDTPGDATVSTELDVKASACVTDLSTSMAAAIEAGGGSTIPSTTAPPFVPDTTFVPETAPDPAVETIPGSLPDTAVETIPASIPDTTIAPAVGG